MFRQRLCRLVWIGDFPRQEDPACSPPVRAHRSPREGSSPTSPFLFGGVLSRNDRCPARTKDVRIASRAPPIFHIGRRLPLGTEGYFALAKEWRLRRALGPSLTRRPRTRASRPIEVSRVRVCYVR